MKAALLIAQAKAYRDLSGSFEVAIVTGAAAGIGIAAAQAVRPRIPVSLAVTVRMQSPARAAGNKCWFEVDARGAQRQQLGRATGQRHGGPVLVINVPFR